MTATVSSRMVGVLSTLGSLSGLRVVPQIDCVEGGVLYCLGDTGVSFAWNYEDDVFVNEGMDDDTEALVGLVRCVLHDAGFEIDS